MIENQRLINTLLILHYLKGMEVLKNQILSKNPTYIRIE